MAQSNSVQREPSMEEILASIRRIIEDSDTSRRPSEPPQDAPSGASNPGANDVQAFRLGLRDEKGNGSAADDARAQQTSNGAVSGRPWQEDESFQEESRSKATDAPPAQRSVQAPAPADEIEMELNLDDFADAGRDEGGEDEAQSSDLPAPIMSDQAGRQVAASFGELSAAFEARSRKSFDQIAEDMLRPMLQDWLDNNLPHLVERLVREEIERIARGPAAPR